MCMIAAAMVSKGVFITILLVAVASIDAQKLHVAVYYESLCGDSIRFITNQLNPAYEDLKNYIEILFVPFGKSWVSSLEFYSLNIRFKVDNLTCLEEWWRNFHLPAWPTGMCW